MESHCSYGLQVVKAEKDSQEEPVSHAAHAEQFNQQPQDSQHQLDPCEPCGPAQLTKRRMPNWGRAMRSRNFGRSSIDTCTADCKAEEGMIHAGSVPID